MDAIAAAAGISKGSVYRYFPDKQQLFEAALTCAIDEALLNFRIAPDLDPDTLVRRLLDLAGSTRFIAAYRLSLTQGRESPAARTIAESIDARICKPFAECWRQTEGQDAQAETALLRARLAVAALLGASLMNIATPESLAERIGFLLRACGLHAQSPQADGF